MSSKPTSIALRTRVERRDEVHLIVAEGELDVATARRLTDEVARVSAGGGGGGGDAGGGPIVLDLAGVAFMDSSGLRALLDSERTAATAGRPFALSRPSEGVRRVLELVALLDRMTVLDDLAPSALARLTQG